MPLFIGANGIQENIIFKKVGTKGDGISRDDYPNLNSLGGTDWNYLVNNNKDEVRCGKFLPKTDSIFNSRDEIELFSKYLDPIFSSCFRGTATRVLRDKSFTGDSGYTLVRRYEINHPGGNRYQYYEVGQWGCPLDTCAVPQYRTTDKLDLLNHILLEHSSTVKQMLNDGKTVGDYADAIKLYGAANVRALIYIPIGLSGKTEYLPLPGEFIQKVAEYPLYVDERNGVWFQVIIWRRMSEKETSEHVCGDGKHWNEALYKCESDIIIPEEKESEKKESTNQMSIMGGKLGLLAGALAVVGLLFWATTPKKKKEPVKEMNKNPKVNSKKLRKMKEKKLDKIFMKLRKKSFRR